MLKEETMELSIDQILSLKSYSEDKVYGLDEFEMFQPLSGFDTWNMSLNVEDQLMERELVLDKCFDGRSRSLLVILYKEVPFALYQYMGKGYVKNEVIFDKVIYEDFIRDYINEYLQSLDSIEVSNTNEKYIIQKYNAAHFEIIENGIVSVNK